MSYIETSGGTPSRSHTYAKIMDLLRQLQDQTAIMGHLHNTESNDMDKTLAKGWLGMSEMFKLIQHKVTELAMNKLH